MRNPQLLTEFFHKFSRQPRAQLARAIRDFHRSHARATTVNFSYFFVAEKFGFFRHDSPLRQIFLASDFLLPDGIALQTLARSAQSLRLLPKNFLLPNHNGTDFLPFFLEFLAREFPDQRELTLFGANPDVLPTAAARLAEKFPLRFATHGYQDFSRSTRENSAKNSAKNSQKKSEKIQIFLVARGSPRQEKRVHENRTQLDQIHALVFSVGGLLDFIAGTEQRAPRFFRGRVERLRRALRHPRKNFAKTRHSLTLFPKIAGFSLRILLKKPRDSLPPETDPSGEKLF